MVMPNKKSLKLDVINRKILAQIHLQSDISNARLAEIVNLSSEASCSQPITRRKRRVVLRRVFIVTLKCI